jgi:hypothetical protein
MEKESKKKARREKRRLRRIEVKSRLKMSGLVICMDTWRGFDGTWCWTTPKASEERDYLDGTRNRSEDSSTPSQRPSIHVVNGRTFTKPREDHVWLTCEIRRLASKTPNSVHMDTCEGWDMVLRSETDQDLEAEEEETRSQYASALACIDWLPPDGEMHTLQELHHYMSLYNKSLSHAQGHASIPNELNDPHASSSGESIAVTVDLEDSSNITCELAVHKLVSAAGNNNNTHQRASHSFPANRRPLCDTTTHVDTCVPCIIRKDLSGRRNKRSMITTMRSQRGLCTNQTSSSPASLDHLPVDTLSTVCMNLKARSILRLCSTSKFLYTAIGQSNIWRSLYELHATSPIPDAITSAEARPHVWRELYRALFLHNTKSGSKFGGGWRESKECVCPVDGCGAVLNAPEYLEEHVTLHYTAPLEDATRDSSVPAIPCPYCTCSVPCKPATLVMSWQHRGWDLHEAKRALARARSDNDRKWHDRKLMPIVDQLPAGRSEPRGVKREGKSWQSALQVCGTKVILGGFKHKEHAALLYDAAKRLLQPPCAPVTGLNYPMCRPPARVSRAIEKLIHAKLAVKFLSKEAAAWSNYASDG